MPDDEHDETPERTALVCECGACRTCDSRERQRRYRKNPADRERLRANDARRRRKPSRRAAVARAVVGWRERNPEKKRAVAKVNNAIRDGKIQRGQCEQHGSGCRGGVEAHHDDYSRPLDVRWLCKGHHEDHHHEETARA
jgi:hypothetical protein